MSKELLKSKTVWTGIAGIVAAVGGFFTGDIEMGTAVQTGVTALIGIFLRTSVEKIR